MKGNNPVAEQDSSEPLIAIESREQLLYLLSEAAEIEHNLMCCYLFAAFSLKQGTGEDLTPDELAAVRTWRQQIVAVAVEEMTHLALVANLTTALGGVAHFSRPNFPAAPGLYPSGIGVSLAPFDRQTLQHFLFLERPEGFDVPDGAGFSAPTDYVRGTVRGKCMPSAQDYLTVGHLYRAIGEGLAAMAAARGEEAIFIGDPSAQVGAGVVGLPGLCAVTDLESAQRAIDTIVRQGEGSVVASPESHFGRFSAMAEQYDALVGARPTFTPHRPVARNPVMRRPPTADDKVFIDDPEAAKALDLANALYGQMLRCLAQAFGRRGAAPAKRLLIDTGIELMFQVTAVSELLTLLPASERHPGQTAGISFAMLRDVARVPEGADWLLLSERLGELAASAAGLRELGPAIADIAQRLASLKATFDKKVAALPGEGPRLALPEPTHGAQGAPGADAPAARRALPADGAQIARGEALTLRFEPTRCIHSRFCVLGLPKVYKANVQGAWLDPDTASLEANIAVAHNCPSGAIQYERLDGGPQEAAPEVNLVATRENGPYAFRGPLILDGAPIGFRATLCRCGGSKNKPFCDGSHSEIAFTATGEPPTGDFEALVSRDGPVEIAPQRNGPLAVHGNIEVVSGTGRTVMKTTSAKFCRCGHSNTKPFCDGAHAKIGFVT